MSSFKVQCPSCETQVLIKNPNLVGSKVECPKCKYRFKVETPAAEAAAPAGKPDKKDAKAGKPAAEKKGKGGTGGNKKLVGIGLAVAAVGLLGVGGYVMFGGEKPKPPSNTYRPPPLAQVGTTPDATENDKDKKDPEGAGKKDATPAVPAAPKSDKEPTNLLPGKSVAVFRFDIGRLRQTPAGGLLFDASTADLVKSSMGFELGDIEQYYHCSVGEKERSPVGVIRLRVPVPEKQLAGRIAGAGPAKTVAGRALVPVAANPLLSAAGNALAGRTLFAEVYTTPPPPPAKAPAYGVCVYDTQTVLVGEFAALETYLAGLKDGYPEFQTVVQKDGAAAAGGKGYTTNPTYLSLDPKLRAVVLAMQTDPAGEPMAVHAEKFDNALYPRAGVRKEYAPVATALDPVLARTEHLGANLVAFTPRQVVGTVRFFTASDPDARAVALEKLTPTLTDALPLLGLLLQTRIDFRNYADPNYVPPASPGGVGPGDGLPGGGRPMGPGGPPPGGPGPGGLPRGSAGGPPPGSSAGGPPPGMLAGGPGGMRPPPGGPTMPPGGPGMNPGGPTDPTQPAPPAGPASSVSLRLIDQTVAVGFDLNWPDDTYYRLIGPRLLGYVNQLKGKAAVYAGTDTWHALGRAVKQYTAEKKAFPPGTVPVSRPSDHDVRFGVTYPPAQRASFFVELLPPLGKAALRQQFDPSQGWLSDRNAVTAGSWVPELLVTYYPQTAWRATTPLAPDFTFGGTNFVAVAGVGLDAPRYSPKNPTQAKQLGITGYEWGSKLDEVTDGPENTIYLLQTPPGAPRPWAAGGGSTVVGLDPANPMAAFKHTRPDGKEGTYAVMGDGAIRWLPADIDPKVFLALATRAGGEPLPDLNDVAPLVQPAGTKTELKATVPAPAPTPPPTVASPPAAAPMPKEKDTPPPEPKKN